MKKLNLRNTNDFKIFALSIVVLFFICQTIVLNNELQKTKATLAVVEKEFAKSDSIITAKEKEQQKEKLTDWDMFTLALMKVESDYDITAKSSAGARGYFQFMPVYVKEVNRIHGANYKFEDVINSFQQSYEVFTLMQKAHNKDFSMDKALTLHNGNHKWYHRRVYQEMKDIKKYEEMRQKVKNASCKI